MGMFDYVKVDTRLKVPGSESSTAVWQTKSGPECLGLFRLSPDGEGCTYTYAKDLGGASPEPTYKVLNMFLNFYRAESGSLVDYYAKIVAGELVSIVKEDGTIVWEKS
jgi:hypothetical protein